MSERIFIMLWQSSVSLEQGNVRLELCMFDLAACGQAPLVVSRLICVRFSRCIIHEHTLVGGSAHESVFSGLSWPTLDKPFFLYAGNISPSLYSGMIRAAFSCSH